METLIIAVIVLGLALMLLSSLAWLVAHMISRKVGDFSDVFRAERSPTYRETCKPHNLGPRERPHQPF